MLYSFKQVSNELCVPLLFSVSRMNVHFPALVCRYAIILGSTTEYESLQNQILLGFKYKVSGVSIRHGLEVS